MAPTSIIRSSKSVDVGGQDGLGDSITSRHTTYQMGVSIKENGLPSVQEAGTEIQTL